MSDALFPSGPWTGFYNYSPKDKHRMELGLTFAGGKMTGDGNDDIGRFTIRGQYDTKSLECSWVKTYIGAHDVFYRGFREGKGIWGTWDIKLRNHGGFHIWPKRAGQDEAQFEAVEQVAHAPAVAEEVEQRKLAIREPNAAKPQPLPLRLAKSRRSAAEGWK